MVENKCIQVFRNQREAIKDPEYDLSDTRCVTLISLHRALLHEFCDFFMLSQHPQANQRLRQLAHQLQLPSRLWNHGIRNLLGLLRERLPQSHEHMVSALHLAYETTILLYEMAPMHRHVWAERLGDIARYR